MSEVDDGKTPTTRKCLSALGFQKMGWLMGLEPKLSGNRGEPKILISLGKRQFRTP